MKNILTRTRLCGVAAALALIPPLASPGQASDWPAHRHDAQRTGMTASELAFPLRKAWVYTPAQPPRPAWGERQVALNRTDYDYAPQLVSADGIVCFGSSADDTVRALDLATGEERWHVTVGGPVRIAPQIHRGKVYFADDDGRVHCVNAADGRPLWSFAAAPWPDQLMGNQRMISRWPCRTGVVAVGDTVYATAGLWPSDGIYLYALDSETGQVRWVNDTASVLGTVFNDAISGNHQGEFIFTHLAPEGPLLATDTALIVPQGHANPRLFRTSDGRYTGGMKLGTEYGDAWAEKILQAHLKDGLPTPLPDAQARAAQTLGARTSGSAGSGGTWATIAENRVYVLAMHRSRTILLNAWDVDTGKPVDTRRSYHLLPQIGKGLNRTLDEGRVSVVMRNAEIIGRNAYDLILAGNTLILGQDGMVQARPVPEAEPEIWSAPVTGQARSLAVADGKLLVGTRTGEITCFVPDTEPPAACRHVRATPPPSTYAPAPNEIDRQALERIRAAGVDRGLALLVGDADARLAMLLAEETSLQLIIALEDPAQASRLRETLISRTLLYGARVSVDVLPGNGQLPYAQFCANAAIVTGADAAITASELYRVLHPCGGILLAPGQPADAAAKWLAECNALDGEFTSEDGSLPAIVRGQLPGANDFNTPHADARLKWPLQTLWFGGPEPVDILDYRGGELFAGPPSVAYGRRFGQGETGLYALDAYNGIVLWRRPMMGHWTDFGKFLGRIRKVVDVTPGREGTIDTAKSWRSLYHRSLRASDTDLMLALGEGFFRGQGTALIRLSADTGEQREIMGPYLPGPLFDLSAPKTWTLNMRQTQQESTPDAPAPDIDLGKGEETEIEMEELAGELEEADLAQQPMAAESGRLVMSRTRDALILELTTRDPELTRFDLWDLFFDFRATEARYGLYGMGTFGLRIVPAVDGASAPRLVDLSGIAFPTCRLTGRTTPEGSQAKLEIPLAEIEKLTGRRPDSFDFAATFCAHNETDDGLAPIRQRHLFGDTFALGLNVKWARIFLDAIPDGYRPTRPAFVIEWLPGRTPDRWRIGTPLRPVAPDPDLMSEPREHPLTGEWGEKLFRTGGWGCGGFEYSAFTVFSRPSKPSIGVYDFADDSGLRFFGGVSWPCGSSAIAALGLLNFKESRFRCDCAPPMKTSLALAPSERHYHEDWALFYDRAVTTLIRQAHLNLGAFGDKRDADRRLWLSFPRQFDRGYGYAMDPTTVKAQPRPAAESPTGAYIRHVPAGLMVPGTVDYDPQLGPYRRNADRLTIAGTTCPWLYTSGIRGVRKLALTLDFRQPIAATKASGAVTTDGLLDDACWQGREAVLLPNSRTRVMASFDATHLYLAATRPSTFDRRGALIAWQAATSGEDAPVWEDDALEVFLARRDRDNGTVLHLGLSASGARYDAQATENGALPEAADWSMAWKSAVHADDQAVSFEMAIPLAELGKAGLPHEALALNVLMNVSDTRGDATLYPGGERRNWNLKTPTSESLYSLGGAGRARCRNFTPLCLGEVSTIPSRTFAIALHFAEPDPIQPGERVFDVKLQGTTVLKDFDISREAGGPNRAVVKTFPAASLGSDLNLEFVAREGSKAPLLCALELRDRTFSPSHGPGPGRGIRIRGRR